MARELRTLLLWGRRLRASALAAAPGGEGSWTGGRERGCRGIPNSQARFVLRGWREDGTLRAALETEIYTPNARRAANAQCFVRFSSTWLSAAPGCAVSPGGNSFESGLCDYSRGFSLSRGEVEGPWGSSLLEPKAVSGSKIRGGVCAGNGPHQRGHLSLLVAVLFLLASKLFHTRVLHEYCISHLLSGSIDKT